MWLVAKKIFATLLVLSITLNVNVEIEEAMIKNHTTTRIETTAEVNIKAATSCSVA